jgi:hypothetical protein
VRRGEDSSGGRSPWTLRRGRAIVLGHQKCKMSILHKFCIIDIRCKQFWEFSPVESTLGIRPLHRPSVLFYHVYHVGLAQLAGSFHGITAIRQ